MITWPFTAGTDYRVIYTSHQSHILAHRDCIDFFFSFHVALCLSRFSLCGWLSVSLMSRSWGGFGTQRIIASMGFEICHDNITQHMIMFLLEHSNEFILL